MAPREPREEILHIRLKADELQQIKEAAAAHHLETSTWARQSILLAVDAWQRRRDARARKASKDGH
jgi:hypothetical protein